MVLLKRVSLFEGLRLLFLVTLDNAKQTLLFGQTGPRQDPSRKSVSDTDDLDDASFQSHLDQSGLVFVTEASRMLVALA